MTAIPECGKCGLPHATRDRTQACKAHKAGTGGEEPCRQSPVRGADVCYYHGGASPQIRRRIQEDKIREVAERELKQFGRKVVVDPADELLDLIAHTAGYVRFLRTKVDELDHLDMGWGLSRQKEGGEDFGTTYEAKPNVWIQMLSEWSDKHSRLLVEALKLKLDERRVKIAEAQGNAIIAVLDGVLIELGHNPNDVRTADIVAKHLRLVSKKVPELGSAA